MKQLWVALVTDDAWSYLVNLPIPTDFVCLSGHFGKKRHAMESEVVVVGARDSWLRVSTETMTAVSAPSDLSYEQRMLPIPWVSFKLSLEEMVVFRDPFAVHPLYWGKLTFGFAFSPRKEWLWAMGASASSVPPGIACYVDEASIHFRKLPTRVLDAQRALTMISKLAKTIILVPSREVDVAIALRLALLGVKKVVIPAGLNLVNRVLQDCGADVIEVATCVSSDALREVCSLVEETRLDAIAIGLFVQRAREELEPPVAYCGPDALNEYVFKCLWPEFAIFASSLARSIRWESLLAEERALMSRYGAELVREARVAWSRLLSEVSSRVRQGEVERVFKSLFPLAPS